MNDFSFTDLRHHWNECAARERANPPPGRPTIEHMREHGRDMAEAPTTGHVWVISAGSEGVFRGRCWSGRWMIEDAGDLWPTKPVKWLPIEPAFPQPK